MSASTSPFPPITEPPFFRPITPEAFGELVNDPPGPGDLDLQPGWDLALIGVAVSGGRVTGWGWVKGSLAVHLLPSKASGADVGVLTHLPTGASLFRFFSDECAAKAGDLITPLTDWSSDMAPPPAGLQTKIITTLQSAGFELVFVGSPDVGFERVWCSRAGAMH